MTTTINASPTNGLVQTADGSGVLKVQSNGVTTNALAWVRFTSSGNASILASYNVSSITYNTTGSYTVNFATATTDANYAPVVSGFSHSAGRCTGFSMFCNSSVAYSAPSTSSFTFQTAQTTTTAAVDASYCSVAVFGN